MLSPTRLYILLVVLMLLVGIVFIYVLIKRAQRKSAQKEAEAGAADKDDAGKAQSPQLNLRDSSVWLKLSFSRAMRSIRAYGKGSLYRIPWYLMVGEAQSGKTTALGSTGLDLLSEEPDEEKAGVKQGVNWFFFDQGIVLDVAGDFVLRADGATSNARSWEYLLKLIRRHRPERPLDGIILTIPCSDLLGMQNADPASKLKLEQKADLLYANLVEARKTLGLNLPVYVLVTKCDEVMGFRSLCNEIPSRLDEMFGWSSPYTREIAYRSEWVTEAFQTLYRYLFYLQMEIFAARSHVINSDELFMLPSEMRAMRKPLQIYLDQIFKESAYHDAFFLRGIYFCGDSAGGVLPTARALAGAPEPEVDWLLPPPNPSRVVAPEPATTPDGRKPVFLAHLFERKIFQEDLLARPVNRMRLSRNRLVRVAQVLSLAIPLVGALGILATYSGLKAREREFYKYLTREEQDLKEVRDERAGRVNEERARYREANLFEAMTSMSGKSFFSFFIPGSWFSGVGENSNQSISSAYPYVVLDSLRRQLDCRTENKLVPRDSSADCYAALGSQGGTLNVLDNCGLEAAQSEYSVSAFIEGFNELMRNRERYNRLIRDDGSSLDDLNQLLLYVNHAPLPANFDPHNSLFVRALATTVRRPALRSTDQSVYDRAACKVEGLVTEIYDESFKDKNVLYGRRGDITKAIALLAQPENIKLATRRFNYPSPFEGMSYPDGLKELSRALEDLYNERFMSREPGPRTETQTNDQAEWAHPVYAHPVYAHAARAVRAWDKTSLQQAIDLYKDYVDFVENNKYNRRETLDYKAKQAALSDVTKKIGALVTRARVIQSPPPPLPGESERRASIRAEIKNFVDAQNLLAQLLEICRRLRIDVGLRDKVFDQVISLMGEVDAEFMAAGFYQPARPYLSWWTLDNPFHPYTLFGVASADELEAYLLQQREGIADLARQYARPLLDFMDAQNVTLRSSNVDWRAILDQLEKYDAKRPGTTVAVLEEFIRDMEKVKIEDCFAIMSGGNIRPADYFITKRDELRVPFHERCDELYGGKIARDELARRHDELAAYETKRNVFFKALKNYAELECLFNKTLAHKFPFSPLPQREPFEEADPEKIAAFFEKFAANRAAAEEALKQAPDYGITPNEEAINFLKEMDEVKVFFDSFLAKKPLYPTYDLGLSFRVQKGVQEVGASQIIDWAFTAGTKRVSYLDKDKTAGWGYADPLTLTLRWANDSPILPGSDFPPFSHMNTNGKVVTLSFSNNWSLLLLILKYRGTPGDFAQRADLEPYTLKVVIPAQANAALPISIQNAQPDSLKVEKGLDPPQTVAFMRVMLMAPGKKDPLLLPDVFPKIAPQLRYKNHTLVEVEQECP
ncbi:MAG TPA: type VI secretion protein IcmF/TssM N-terminal domain-containing protein [Pyrinomonadaceae bacterium]|nr:type VI secretion protein IcmF/TssM N-terminal domain-containing protein [Pyrinomonadaceae bacterium]